MLHDLVFNVFRGECEATRPLISDSSELESMVPIPDRSSSLRDRIPDIILKVMINELQDELIRSNSVNRVMH